MPIEMSIKGPIYRRKRNRTVYIGKRRKDREPYDKVPRARLLLKQVLKERTFKP